MKPSAGPSAVAPGRKRHLPIVKEPAGEEGDPPRAAWQWVGFGALAIFVVWLPLAAIALALVARGAAPSDSASAAATVPLWSALAPILASILALGVAAIAGGFLVGKWAGPHASVSTAALAGVAASAAAVAGSWVSLGFAPGALLIVPIAVGFASLGGWLGRRVA